MFLPTEQELAQLTESKMLAFHGTSSRLKFITFTPTTRKSIKDFFKHIIESETEIQKLRLQLMQANVNIHQVFCSFDKQKEGRITAETIKIILDRFGFGVEKDDVQNLFLRVTHRVNADSLNFQEFYAELNFKNYEK